MKMNYSKKGKESSGNNNAPKGVSVMCNEYSASKKNVSSTGSMVNEYSFSKK